MHTKMQLPRAAAQPSEAPSTSAHDAGHPVWVQLLWCYTAGLLILYTAGSFVLPISLHSDCAAGFNVWFSMKRGAPFNCTVSPDPQDIGKDAAGVFLSWWTPGQYLVPGLLADAGFTLGRAMTVTVAAFTLLGLLAWYKVYRAFGFSDLIASLSCAIIASVRDCSLAFDVYSGGEVLIFGTAPLILLWALKLPVLAPWHVLGLAAAFLVAFFMKSSALIFALGLSVGCALANWSRSGPSLMPRCLACFKWGAAFLAAYAAAHLLYNSWGPTPMVRRSPGVSLHPTNVLFPIAAPIVSALNLDGLFNFVFLNPSRPGFRFEWYRSYQFEWYWSALVMAPLACAACLVYWSVLRSNLAKEYRLILLGFLAVYTIGFSALNLAGASVDSFKASRHLRLAALILLPGALAVAMDQWRVWVRGAAGVAVIIACLFGAASFPHKWLQLKQRDAVGTHGFTHQLLDRDALHWLIHADSNLPTANGLFYVTSPEIGMEIRTGRFLSTHADFESNELLASRAYLGKVDSLFLLLPNQFLQSGKAEIILASFKDYQTWSSMGVGNFTAYYPRGQQYVPLAAAH